MRLSDENLLQDMFDPANDGFPAYLQSLSPKAEWQIRAIFQCEAFGAL